MGGSVYAEVLSPNDFMDQAVSESQTEQSYEG